MTDTNQKMESLTKDLQELPKVGDNIDGIVIANERNTLYVDLSPLGTGIIFGKEYLVIKDLIKNLPIGGEVTAKIIDLEGENGYIELSLKEAKQAEV
jgi:predicted RNA-binding protein with RPS1 domain